MDGEGRIYLQETELELEALAPRLIAITSNNPDVRIFLRFDKTIRYGRVMEVMGTVNGAGFTKIALITEPLGSGTAGKKRKKAAKK